VSKRELPRVAVVYTHFPHYRSPVFRSLAKSRDYDFEFFYDARGINETIVSGVKDDGHHSLAVRTWRGLIWQFGAIRLAFSDKFDGYIFLGNPFIISTWIAALMVRLRGKPVYFWTHGWLRREKGVAAFLRLLFYRLANHLLVYGERAIELGQAQGYPPAQIHTIYNSLDYEKQAKIRDRILRQSGKLPNVSGANAKPYFLMVGRLVKPLNVELAFDAIEIGKVDAELVIVGDGPEKSRLVRDARRRSLPVRFMGAIYDEEQLGRLFLGACAVISPGKVGLLAMHSLAYGASLITHGDFDNQMPEVEAIVPGVTGAFFERNDASALASRMNAFLNGKAYSVGVAEGKQRAIAMIEDRYTADAQVLLITEALNIELGRGA